MAVPGASASRQGRGAVGSNNPFASGQSPPFQFSAIKNLPAAARRHLYQIPQPHDNQGHPLSPAERISVLQKKAQSGGGNCLGRFYFVFYHKNTHFHRVIYRYFLIVSLKDQSVKPLLVVRQYRDSSAHSWEKASSHPASDNGQTNLTAPE